MIYLNRLGPKWNYLNKCMWFKYHFKLNYWFKLEQKGERRFPMCAGSLLWLTVGWVGLAPWLGRASTRRDSPCKPTKSRECYIVNDSKTDDVNRTETVFHLVIISSYDKREDVDWLYSWGTGRKLTGSAADMFTSAHDSRDVCDWQAHAWRITWCTHCLPLPATTPHPFYPSTFIVDTLVTALVIVAALTSSITPYSYPNSSL